MKKSTYLIFGAVITVLGIIFYNAKMDESGGKAALLEAGFGNPERSWRLVSLDPFNRVFAVDVGKCRLKVNLDSNRKILYDDVAVTAASMKSEAKELGVTRCF